MMKNKLEIYYFDTPLFFIYYWGILKRITWDNFEENYKDVIYLGPIIKTESNVKKPCSPPFKSLPSPPYHLTFKQDQDYTLLVLFLI